MFSWMRPKSRLRDNISARGLLSSSETGLVRDLSSSAASQRAPMRAIPIGSVRYVMNVKVLPGLRQPPDRSVEIVGEHCERRSVDRACRGAAHNGKRILLGPRQQFPHRLQHADLIGCPGSASRENESCLGLDGFGVQSHKRKLFGSRRRSDGVFQLLRVRDCFSSPKALASTTVSAVMLTMRLTVAEEVRMC